MQFDKPSLNVQKEKGAWIMKRLFIFFVAIFTGFSLLGAEPLQKKFRRDRNLFFSGSCAPLDSRCLRHLLLVPKAPTAGFAGMTTFYKFIIFDPLLLLASALIDKNTMLYL